MIFTFVMNPKIIPVKVSRELRNTLFNKKRLWKKRKERKRDRRRIVEAL